MFRFSDLLARFAPTLSVHHTLQRTRAVAMDQFPDGRIAKVVGRARALTQPLEAPLSHRACVFYRIEVHVLDVAHAGWTPLFEHLGGNVFTLSGNSTHDDDDALVEMSRARVSLMTDVDTLSRPRRVNRPFIEHLLRERSYPFHRWLANAPLTYSDGLAVRQLRCIESTIRENERIAVCGHGFREVRNDPDRTTNYRSMATRLVFRAQRRSPLLISDRPQTLR